MAVYVDSAENRYGRMKMCHMLADSEEELHLMAMQIGVLFKWLQRSRDGVVHYDICKSKRALAVEAGAIAVGRSEIVALMRRQRKGKRTNDSDKSNNTRRTDILL